jgi:hypothetical protein
MDAQRDDGESERSPKRAKFSPKEWHEECRINAQLLQQKIVSRTIPVEGAIAIVDNKVRYLYISTHHSKI